MLKFWVDNSFKKRICSKEKDSFENILSTSKTKPNLIETDYGKNCN